MKRMELVPINKGYMMAKKAALIHAAFMEAMPPDPKRCRTERSGTRRGRCICAGRELPDSYGSGSFFAFGSGANRREISHAYSGKELLA